jgi:hypothetical protein
MAHARTFVEDLNSSNCDKESRMNDYYLPMFHRNRIADREALAEPDNFAIGDIDEIKALIEHKINCFGSTHASIMPDDSASLIQYFESFIAAVDKRYLTRQNALEKDIRDIQLKSISAAIEERRCMGKLKDCIYSIDTLSPEQLDKLENWHMSISAARHILIGFPLDVTENAQLSDLLNQYVIAYLQNQEYGLQLELIQQRLQVYTNLTMWTKAYIAQAFDRAGFGAQAKAAGGYSIYSCLGA